VVTAFNFAVLSLRCLVWKYATTLFISGHSSSIFASP
jgi:hypothetical protein